ncbi:hypothetical protein [Burkholderia cenocepacia]|uniref:hypothetical protein n=1 Tax=Burkholderia cenocepacia TaxID=95486 RepID=UPI001B95E0F8|nr:hypothetical protein [Burkholderia cenocepacia]MBR8137203.1 hypothetical protein [Burkholderia cenocepacia]
MSDVALELSTDDANSYPLSNMIQGGGPSGKRGVWEVLLSIGQWNDVERYLEAGGLPYKFAIPPTAKLQPRNNPPW